MTEAESVAFIAAVYKVQSLADGGIRVTFDLPETAVIQAAALMLCQAQGITLEVDCKTTENKNHAVSKRQERKSKWQAPEESGMDNDS